MSCAPYELSCSCNLSTGYPQMFLLSCTFAGLERLVNFGSHLFCGLCRLWILRLGSQNLKPLPYIPQVVEPHSKNPNLWDCIPGSTTCGMYASHSVDPGGLMFRDGLPDSDQ